MDISLGDNVKITKRQLRRIIKEEKVKLLKEELDPYYQEKAREAVENIAGLWGEDQESLFDQHPDMFAGRSTREDWILQVDAAYDVLVKEIMQAVQVAFNKVESDLHDGQFGG